MKCAVCLCPSVRHVGILHGHTMMTRGAAAPSGSVSSSHAAWQDSGCSLFPSASSTQPAPTQINTCWGDYQRSTKGPAQSSQCTIVLQILRYLVESDAVTSGCSDAYLDTGGRRQQHEATTGSNDILLSAESSRYIVFTNGIAGGSDAAYSLKGGSGTWHLTLDICLRNTIHKATSSAATASVPSPHNVIKSTTYLTLVKSTISPVSAILSVVLGNYIYYITYCELHLRFVDVCLVWLLPVTP